MPPDYDAKRLLDQLDTGASERGQCNIYVPALCDKVGLKDRATVERRRYSLLKNN